MKVKWQSNTPKMELKVPSEIKIDGYIPYDPTDEDLTFRNCESTKLFAGNQLSWLLNNYKDKKIRFTGDCSDTKSLFYSCEKEDLSNVIFEDCYGSSGGLGLATLLEGAKTKYPPKIKNCDIFSLVGAFRYARALKTLPSFENCTIAYDGGIIVINQMIQDAHSLEDVNFDLSKTIKLRDTNRYYSFYWQFIQNCFNLKSIVFSLPIVQESPVATYNQFRQFVTDCNRLRHLKFKNYLSSLQMKSQVIDMSGEIGYVYGNNTGYYPKQHPEYFSKDKKIKDDATYQALKDDPDAWAAKPDYSFYNHDSAVETINSLPDTSAYLTENGDTNTIKFTGNAGSKTDGGAINTMTAEEIAVAAARGWTVTFIMDDYNYN